MNQQIVTDLETKARELGFDLFGIAAVRPSDRGAFFRKWLSEGKAGDMGYLARTAEKRLDAPKVLPGAHSVISVAQSYFTESLPEELRNDPARGVIASYAWGSDYHNVILPRLETLAVFLREEIPHVQTRCFVDGGPVMEKEYAERAGLGFIGKNTLLISPRAGSWLFLGEILTTADLPPTLTAQMPSCGTCRRCIEACPTGALDTEYTLDASRCVSYLTIEHKSDIPRDLQKKIGNNVFGCDKCQSCCPWNGRFALASREESYRGTLERQAPLLAELAALSEEEFRARFAGSALERTGYARLQRNVRIARENS
ncbi:MAG: tRNA epoxyqueuosine(34) reductase QueG [bacterium]|nr:tRNA epoxyqueuosine(34) reductase QueG [bacterium]